MDFGQDGDRSMEWMTRSDVILLLIGVYVAVMALVRLMKRRHDEVVADVKRQVAAHHKRGKKRHHAADEQNRGAA
jgi:hypothetical protein